MIFVTVGTGEQPFDRLLRAFESLSFDEPLVVQRGPSTVEPESAACFDYLPFSEMLAQMQDARVVITHAGVGSVIAALTAGKRPVVVPRRRCFGEAVDDHQVEFARRLADSGLVRLVDDPRDLDDALAKGADDRAVEPAEVKEESPLVADIRSYVAACCSIATPEGSELVVDRPTAAG
jgi:UDP-N-acetylglucosamine transferase subunit ALG13